jgi:predicted Zn finger-like uncharacterized protein/prepilin-type processing-associated H-X9-DG protein
MGAMRISCPFCRQEFFLQEGQIPAYAGRQAPCSKCGGVFTVVSDAAGVHAIASEAIPMAAAAPLDAPNAPVPSGGNSLATAGLVCGIVGLFTCGLLSIPGVICSILGLKRANAQQGQGRGLAIGGLCVSCAALLVVPLILSILLPLLGKARETANRARCASHLQQIGAASLMYCSANRGQFAPDIPTLMSAQGLAGNVLTCPSADSSLEKNIGGARCIYIYVGRGLTSSSPMDAVLAYEPLEAHAGDGMNVLWADGHVSFENNASARQITAALHVGQNPPR